MCVQKRQWRPGLDSGDKKNQPTNEFTVASLLDITYHHTAHTLYTAREYRGLCWSDLFSDKLSPKGWRGPNPKMMRDERDYSYNASVLATERQPRSVWLVGRTSARFWLVHMTPCEDSVTVHGLRLFYSLLLVCFCFCFLLVCLFLCFCCCFYNLCTIYTFSLFFSLF